MALCQVFFNADSALPAFPDTTFLQQLHAGLPPSHRQQLQVRNLSCLGCRQYSVSLADRCAMGRQSMLCTPRAP